MLIGVYKSRTVNEKVIADEEKERRGPKKDVHLKTPTLMYRVSPRFQPKKRPRDFFVGPPLPPRWWFDVVKRNPPSPLMDHVVYVPSLSSLVFV